MVVIYILLTISDLSFFFSYAYGIFLVSFSVCFFAQLFIGLFFPVDSYAFFMYSRY